MNHTSLRHLTTLCRIYAAMKRAIRLGYAQYVANKKGQAFLRVNYSRNEVNAFSFWHGQKDVTNLVLSVLRMQEIA
jgi:hypothetical protein